MGLFRSAGQATVFRQSTAPQGALSGDMWVDTSQNPVVVKATTDGTTWNGIVSAQTNVSIGGISDTLEHFIQDSGFS